MCLSKWTGDRCLSGNGVNILENSLWQIDEPHECLGLQNRELTGLSLRKEAAALPFVRWHPELAEERLIRGTNLFNS